MREEQKNITKSLQKVSEGEIKQYILQRFEDVKKSHKIKDLVSFQAMNKYMIMSRSQEELKILGKIVAGYKKNNLQEIMPEYEKHLSFALEKEPTIKTHCNVIMHMFGHFSKDFNKKEKQQFFDLLERFRNKEITIGKILAEINPVIFRFNNTYLAQQTYFLLYVDSSPGNLFDFLERS